MTIDWGLGGHARTPTNYNHNISHMTCHGHSDSWFTARHDMVGLPVQWPCMTRAGLLLHQEGQTADSVPEEHSSVNR